MKKKKYSKIAKIIPLIDWLMYMCGYTLVIMIISYLFDSIQIDHNHFILWSAIIVLVTYIFNKTVKPILVTLTIPITGITLGLFYPFINVFILKLADWLLGKHFDVTNIYIGFFAAILLSVMNFIMEEIIKSIIRRVKKREEKRHEK